MAQLHYIERAAAAGQSFVQQKSLFWQLQLDAAWDTDICAVCAAAALFLFLAGCTNYNTMCVAGSKVRLQAHHRPQIGAGSCAAVFFNW